MCGVKRRPGLTHSDNPIQSKLSMKKGENGQMIFNSLGANGKAGIVCSRLQNEIRPGIIQRAITSDDGSKLESTCGERSASKGIKSQGEKDLDTAILVNSLETLGEQEALTQNSLDSNSEARVTLTGESLESTSGKD